MDKITEWKIMMMNSLSKMTDELSEVVPNVLAAIFVLIVGWLLVKLLVGIIKKALKLANFDKIDDKLNEVEFFGHKKFNFNLIIVICKFVKWTLYVILLILISDILNLRVISEEIGNLLRYLPQLFSALVIFTLGLLLANFLKKSLRSFFESMGFSGSKIIGHIVFFGLMILVSITALNQAGVDTYIITSNITLLLGGFLLAFSLAFGLGAKSIVTDLLRTFYARKTFEIDQKVIYKGTEGVVEAINDVSFIIKTPNGKLIVPIKDIVESEIKVID